MYSLFLNEESTYVHFLYFYWFLTSDHRADIFHCIIWKVWERASVCFVYDMISIFVWKTKICQQRDFKVSGVSRSQYDAYSKLQSVIDHSQVMWYGLVSTLNLVCRRNYFFSLSVMLVWCSSHLYNLPYKRSHALTDPRDFLLQIVRLANISLCCRGYRCCISHAALAVAAVIHRKWREIQLWQEGTGVKSSPEAWLHIFLALLSCICRYWLIELLCQGVGTRGISVDIHIRDMFKLCVRLHVHLCERV